jgi:putative ABC transport system ATP-binding protein
MSAQPHPLVIRNLVKSFRQGAVSVPVLSGVTFTARRAEFIALMGPSGSGKSTLLHCIAGLTGHDSGQIYLNDELVSGLSDRRLTEIRRKQLGFIFQSFNLLPNLNVRDNICLPILAAGAKVDEAFLQSIVERLGIADKLSRRPSDLSGGEQQRVAIARALLPRPALILADEPTGSLDSHSGQELCQQLQRCCADEQQTILLVTHEAAVALWAQRVLVLLDGAIVGEFPVTPELNALDLAAKYNELICSAAK